MKPSIEDRPATASATRIQQTDTCLQVKTPAACASKSEQITIYQYCDDAGQVVSEKLYYGPKRFNLRRPFGACGYVNGLGAGWYRPRGLNWKPIPNATDPTKQPKRTAKWFDEAPRVLYRQPEIQKAITQNEIIFVVATESDADALAALSCQATTNQDGAGEKWRPAYGEVLRGARIVFIRSQDQAGKAHFNSYAPALAASAKQLHWLDLPEGVESLSEWLAAGHDRTEFEALVASASPWVTTAEILDTAPDTIRRPLCIIGESAYLASWVPVQESGVNVHTLVLLRDDRQLFADKPISGALPMAKIGTGVHLPMVPEPERILSGAGVKKYQWNTLPEPAQVHHRICRVLDHFMDFGNSLGPQSEMVELAALYTLSTYFLDAFSVIGYLWPNGDAGS